MKILYVGSKDIVLRSGERVESFEHTNVYWSLAQLQGYSLEYYHLERMQEIGARDASLEIEARVKASSPDLMILFMNHDLDRDVLRRIARETSTVTLALFSDEDTDLYLRSLAWSTVFDWMMVFYPPAFEAHRRRGANVLGANWAANTEFWKPPTGRFLEKKFGASFVGAAKDERRVFARELARRGVPLECFGGGWPQGAVSFERLVAIVHESKINMNLGFAKPMLHPRSLARIFISPRAGSSGYRFDAHHAMRNLRTILNRRRPQSRARPFELSAAGAFVMTNEAPLFGEPFIPGREMVYYRGAQDAAEKIRYYLTHDAEREAIAQAGYERTVREHSFKKRFTDAFDTIYAGNPKRRGVARVL